MSDHCKYRMSIWLVLALLALFPIILGISIVTTKPDLISTEAECEAEIERVLSETRSEMEDA